MAAACASQCGGLNRQLSTLLQALGSARLDLPSANKLNNDCKQLLEHVNTLASLDGSSHELAALRRTLERAPERIEAGVVNDMAYVTRLVASQFLLSACLLLTRLAGLPTDSRLRLARCAFQRVTRHGTASLESVIRMGPALAQMGASTHPTSVLVLSQVELLGHILHETPDEPAGAAAAQLEPEALVLWLRSCASLARALPRQAPVLKALIGGLASRLCHLCCVGLWAPFNSAIAADADLAAALVSLLEPFVAGAATALRLPEELRPAGCSWLEAACAVCAMASQPLLPALRVRLDAEPARAAPKLVAAAQLLEQLPADPSGLGVDPEVHTALALSLAAYVGVLAEQASSTGAVLRQPAMQQQQLLRQLLPCLASLPALLRLVARPQLTAASALNVAAVCEAILPLAELLVQLSNSTAGGSASDTGAASSNQQAEADAGQQAAAWCSAAAAALAAMPLLVRSGMVLQLTAAAGKHLTVATLVAGLLNLQKDAADTIREAVHSQGCPAALQQAIFSLHTAGCRLVAWSDANRVVNQLPLSSGALQQQLDALATAVVAAFELHTKESATPVRPRPLSGKLLEAMMVAHWTAVRTLQPIIPDGPTRLVPSLLLALTASLAACIGTGPVQLSLDPELTQLFGLLLDRAPQDARASTFQDVLMTAIQCPPLTVHLLLSGRLESMLSEMLQLSSSGVIDSDMACELLRFVDDTLPALLQAGREALGSASSGGGPDASEALAALQAAADAVACAPFLEDECEMQQAAAVLRQHVLPPAHELAAALQAWRQRPEQQRELQLQAAQAAARRSCAYLRCANLGGEGGPAAGEGVGSMRCSACRAAWYCGTACSHADWREGGHRRVCKALGAARAAEKERRQQAAAAQAAAAEAGEES